MQGSLAILSGTRRDGGARRATDGLLPMATSRPIIFLLIATGVVCLGIGCVAGVIADRIMGSADSRLDAIRIDLDDLAALNQSREGFERVTLLSARADLLTLVCGNYRHLNARQQTETRGYVAKYNSMAVRVDHEYALPVIGSGAEEAGTQSEYCGVLKLEASKY